MLATQLLGLLGGTRRLGAMLETDPPSQCAAAGKCRSQGRRPRIELSQDTIRNARHGDSGDGWLSYALDVCNTSMLSYLGVMPRDGMLPAML